MCHHESGLRASGLSAERTVRGALRSGPPHSRRRGPCRRQPGPRPASSVPSLLPPCRLCRGTHTRTTAPPNGATTPSRTPRPPPTLFYGLAVRVCDLAAGRTYAAVGPALDTIDSISRARQRGTLWTAAGEGQAVARVPVEVWTLIRQATVAKALEQSRLGMVEEFQCADCFTREVDDITRVECDAALTGLENDDSEHSVEVLWEWLYQETGVRVERTRRLEQVAEDDWLDHFCPEECYHQKKAYWSNIELLFWEPDDKVMVSLTKTTLYGYWADAALDRLSKHSTSFSNSTACTSRSGTATSSTDATFLHQAPPSLPSSIPALQLPPSWPIPPPSLRTIRTAFTPPDSPQSIPLFSACRLMLMLVSTASGKILGLLALRLRIGLSHTRTSRRRRCSSPCGPRGRDSSCRANYGLRQGAVLKSDQSSSCSV
jgi:hypothetical protein